MEKTTTTNTLNDRFQQMLCVTTETPENAGKYNGFDSVDDHEFVLDRLLMALSIACPIGDLNGFVDTLMVTQEADGIHINLDDFSSVTDTLAKFRDEASGILAEIKGGKYGYLTLGYGVVERVEDGKIILSNDGSTWGIPCTEEAVCRELVEEAMSEIVEEFAEDYESAIADFFYGDED